MMQYWVLYKYRAAQRIRVKKFPGLREAMSYYTRVVILRLDEPRKPPMAWALLAEESDHAFLIFFDRGPLPPSIDIEHLIITSQLSL